MFEAGYKAAKTAWKWTLYGTKKAVETIEEYHLVDKTIEGIKAAKQAADDSGLTDELKIQAVLAMQKAKSTTVETGTYVIEGAAEGIKMHREGKLEDYVREVVAEKS